MNFLYQLTKLKIQVSMKISKLIISSSIPYINIHSFLVKCLQIRVTYVKYITDSQLTRSFIFVIKNEAVKIIFLYDFFKERHTSRKV